MSTVTIHEVLMHEDDNGLVSDPYHRDGRGVILGRDGFVFRLPAGATNAGHAHAVFLSRAGEPILLARATVIAAHPDRYAPTVVNLHPGDVLVIDGAEFTFALRSPFNPAVDGRWPTLLPR